jgi:hypothetical protein
MRQWLQVCLPAGGCGYMSQQRPNDPAGHPDR